MKSNPRGYALVINNENFRNNDDWHRKGSDKDFKNIVELFTQLHFEVIKHKDLGNAVSEDRRRDCARVELMD